MSEIKIKGMSGKMEREIYRVKGLSPAVMVVNLAVALMELIVSIIFFVKASDKSLAFSAMYDSEARTARTILYMCAVICLVLIPINLIQLYFKSKSRVVVYSNHLEVVYGKLGMKQINLSYGEIQSVKKQALGVYLQTAQKKYNIPIRDTDLVVNAIQRQMQVYEKKPQGK